MDIVVAISKIKKRIKKDIVETKHFKDKCIERELDPEKVKEIAQANKILGILEQEEGLYKVWFYYEKHKDLNIILRLIGKKIKFVTVFPCYSERRKK